MTKNPDGTWDWWFNTSDGPDDSQTVTITAVDEDGDQNQTTFDLTVNNLPPSVSADNDSVTVNETETATNNGTFGDPAGDNVTLTASAGTLSQNADGTWDWSFDATDGPDQSQTVTINATDEDGDSNTTTFELNVSNTPPSVRADNDTVTVAEGETATNNGTYADVGNDTVTLTASVGTVTKNADGTWDWSYSTADGPNSSTVTITATDDDGATNQTTFELNVTNAPPSVTADQDSVTVIEGENATNTGTWADPGSDTVTLSASVGTVTKHANGTWDWTYNTTGDSGTQTVTITAEDDDGAINSTSFNLTVEEEQALEAGEDFEADFKGCSEVWIVFNNTDQLPVEASIQVYNAELDTEQTVDVTIEPEDVERIPGQYDDRPVYKFNVHDYFGREDGDDKILAVSVGGSSVVENPNRCADDTTGGDDKNGTGNGGNGGNGNGGDGGNGNSGKGASGNGGNGNGP